MKHAKKQIRLDQAAGMTLTAAALDEYEGAVLVFGDSFVTLTMKRRDFDEGRDLTDREPFWTEYFGKATAIRLGILTEEQIAEHKALLERERAKAEEKRERELYEQLKAKYGP